MAAPADLVVREWTAEERIENYQTETGYPNGLHIGDDGRILGIWVMGNRYSVGSGYYGGYPHGCPIA